MKTDYSTLDQAVIDYETQARVKVQSREPVKLITEQFGRFNFTQACEVNLSNGYKACFVFDANSGTWQLGAD